MGVAPGGHCGSWPRFRVKLARTASTLTLRRSHARCAKILLLGAGGAGRTAALKLASEHPAELFLVNRTRSKAEAVVQEIRQRHSQLEVTIGYPAGPVDLVLNATSLGLKTNDSLPCDEKQFAR